MRELIRPTLFLVARLGLFVSVVAWVTAQWRQIHAILDGNATVTMESKGFVLVDWSEPAHYPFSQILTSQVDNVSEFLTESELEPGAVGFGGWSYSETSFGRIVTIRHWLIVTIFALFYGVLIWVYRKRGKELADE